MTATTILTLIILWSTNHLFASRCATCHASVVSPLSKNKDKEIEEGVRIQFTSLLLNEREIKKAWGFRLSQSRAKYESDYLLSDVRREK
jgi:hypothetical protein